jgi:hypothetical protein
MAQRPGRAQPPWVGQYRWTGRAVPSAIGASIALMVVLGIVGPPVKRMAFAPALPQPPWFVHLDPPAVWWSAILWLAESLGAAGLALGLLAARRGWRPRPAHLMLGCVVAVTALMVVPPVDNGDPMLYAVQGRIAALGHSPYIMTPGQLRLSGDPVGTVLAPVYWNFPSRYGPVATATEAAASALARDSTARTIFWLKVWNGLAYMALMLVLDRCAAGDAARRVRVHLLWSVNPLMLFALMANGHNDVLAVAAAASALIALRRTDVRRAVVAGALLGLATAVKAPYALFGIGLAWGARRSPRALAALAAATMAVLIPSYLIAGRAAISATVGLQAVRPNLLWLDIARVLGWQNAIVLTNRLALIGSAALAAILLWRMPPTPSNLPAVRIVTALALGLMILSPLQAASYDAMLFPLVALMPWSRLDWIVLARAVALAAGSTPAISPLDPTWLTVIERISCGGSPAVALAAILVALLWLCWTRAWNPVIGPGDARMESRSDSPGLDRFGDPGNYLGEHLL